LLNHKSTSQKLNIDHLNEMQVKDVDPFRVWDQDVDIRPLWPISGRNGCHGNERNAATQEFTNLGNFRVVGIFDLPDSNVSVDRSRRQQRRVIDADQRRRNDARAVNVLDVSTLEIRRLVRRREQVNFAVDVAEDVTVFSRRWAGDP